MAAMASLASRTDFSSVKTIWVSSKHCKDESEGLTSGDGDQVVLLADLNVRSSLDPQA